MKKTLVLGALLIAAPAIAATPDLNGVWQVITPVTHLTTTDGATPPLQPAAAKIYADRSAQLAKGDRSFDTTLKCKPMGEPRTSYDPDGGPFESLQNPEEIVFGYTWNRTMRFVYLTGKAPDVIGPTYYSTSSGAWHGNKLVLDTESIHDTVLLDAAGLPHSEAMKITETFQLSPDGQTLTENLHFVDPATFTKPWDATVQFKRLPAGTRIAEDVCEERLNINLY
jgi:hypothetical protein